MLMSPEPGRGTRQELAEIVLGPMPAVAGAGCCIRQELAGVQVDFIIAPQVCLSRVGWGAGRGHTRHRWPQCSCAQLGCHQTVKAARPLQLASPQPHLAVTGSKGGVLNATGVSSCAIVYSRHVPCPEGL